MLRPSLLSALALAAFASGASAQSYVLQIDSNATQFTWSGTTSLGDIDEMPPSFTLLGTANAGMTGNGNPVGSLTFQPGGDALISPNLAGEIPNPLVFLPPLATIQLQGAHIAFTSSQSNVDANGNYSTMVTMHILAGTLLVTPITGSPTITDLAGNSSSPAPSNGTMTWDGSRYVLNTPVSGVFPFMDAASGVSGSITLNGTMVAHHVPQAPATFCSSLPNSTGMTATISHSGQPSLGAGALTVHSNNLPANTFGLFFYGPNQIDLPFGNGRRCVGGSLVRFAPQNTGPMGAVSQLIDINGLPAALQAGDQRNFQFWFRDVPAGNSGFNTSNALTVTYTP